MASSAEVIFLGHISEEHYVSLEPGEQVSPDITTIPSTEDSEAQSSVSDSDWGTTTMVKLHSQAEENRSPEKEDETPLPENVPRPAPAQSLSFAPQWLRFGTFGAGVSGRQGQGAAGVGVGGGQGAAGAAVVGVSGRQGQGASGVGGRQGQGAAGAAGRGVGGHQGQEAAGATGRGVGGHQGQEAAGAAGRGAQLLLKEQPTNMKQVNNKRYLKARKRRGSLPGSGQNVSDHEQQLETPDDHPFARQVIKVNKASHIGTSENNYRDTILPDLVNMVSSRHADYLPETTKLLDIVSVIPMSTVPYERGFSVENRIITNGRARLRGENLNMLMRIGIDVPEIGQFEFYRTLEMFRAMSHIPRKMSGRMLLSQVNVLAAM
uniref:HAT C-terminal dimerisation domain-containing protein n=1 Tax=Branchiostoma floridae TaxID=7739 RepID=C3ZVT5_BRAFL|eukprot:XP_002587339.1 hypothetical protein BRAFLDRAFT_100537 [Branchiostoma floridae]